MSRVNRRAANNVTYAGATAIKPLLKLNNFLRTTTTYVIQSDPAVRA